MNYRFLCPSCGKRVDLRMRLSEYTPDGHYCDCGAELRRDPQDFCKTYTNKSGGFYADYPSD